MTTVSILGLGLMGGSLGLALKRKSAMKVHAYARRAATREKAMELGAADRVSDSPAEAVKEADIVVFCAPVLSIPELARACRDSYMPGALLTDVASTKHVLATELGTMSAPFVGSHPIAGSEQTGIEAARADLYDGAVVVITPVPGTADDLIVRLNSFWSKAGARSIVMSPEAHDALIARTSHLPHMVATALARHAGASDDPQLSNLAGPGFRDMTRLALGSPALWHDIVATNPDNIVSELDGFRQVLADLRDLLAKKDYDSLREYLAQSQTARNAIVR